MRNLGRSVTFPGAMRASFVPGAVVLAASSILAGGTARADIGLTEPVTISQYGRLPYFSADGPAGVLRMHLEASPIPLRAVAPLLPRGVSDLVMAAIAKEVDERMASAAEFAGRLSQIVADEMPWGVRP